MAAAVAAHRGGGMLLRSRSLVDSQTNEDMYSNLPAFRELEDLPKAADILKIGMLYKKGVGHEEVWKPMQVILTADRFCFAHEGSTRLVDSIELLDFKDIEMDTHARLVTTKKKKGKGPLRRAAGRRKRLSSVEIGAGSIMLSEGEIPLERNKSMIIATIDGGKHCGRAYCFQAEDDDTLKEWRQAVEAAWLQCVEAKSLAEDTLFERMQKRARGIYKTNVFQFAVVFLIVGNFVLNVVEAEMVPQDGTREEYIFDSLDKAFTAIFTVELIFNLFSNWLWPFFNEGWNHLDLAVVIVSLLSLGFDNLPGVKTIRILRAFRVVRVFKRLHSLRMIVLALGASLVPVGNTFFVLLLATAVYAILGVGLFSTRSPEHFGYFSVAFFTMFQCVTGDGWASDVARTMFRDSEGVFEFDRGVAAFLLSYMLIVMIVIVNIVLAVLLDEFLKAADIEKMESEKLRQAGSEFSHLRSPMDPLMKYLSNFFTSGDFSKQITDLFEFLDVEQTDKLDFQSFCAGLEALSLKNPIHLSEDDYNDITEGYTLCSPDGTMTSEQFHMIMRLQMKLYVQRMATKMITSADDSGGGVRDSGGGGSSFVVFMLKYLVMAVDEIVIHVGFEKDSKMAQRGFHGTSRELIADARPRVFEGTSSGGSALGSPTTALRSPSVSRWKAAKTLALAASRAQSSPPPRDQSASTKSLGLAAARQEAAQGSSQEVPLQREVIGGVFGGSSENSEANRGFQTAREPKGVPEKDIAQVKDTTQCGGCCRNCCGGELRSVTEKLDLLLSRDAERERDTEKLDLLLSRDAERQRDTEKFDLLLSRDSEREHDLQDRLHSVEGTVAELVGCVKELVSEHLKSASASPSRPPLSQAPPPAYAQTFLSSPRPPLPPPQHHLTNPREQPLPREQQQQQQPQRQQPQPQVHPLRTQQPQSPSAHPVHRSQPLEPPPVETHEVLRPDPVEPQSAMPAEQNTSAPPSPNLRRTSWDVDDAPPPTHRAQADQKSNFGENLLSNIADIVGLISPRQAILTPAEQDPSSREDEDAIITHAVPPSSVVISPSKFRPPALTEQVPTVRAHTTLTERDLGDAVAELQAHSQSQLKPEPQQAEQRLATTSILHPPSLPFPDEHHVPQWQQPQAASISSEPSAGAQARGPDDVVQVQQWGGGRSQSTPRLAKTALAPPTSQVLSPSLRSAPEGSPPPPPIDVPGAALTSRASFNVDLPSSPPTDSFSKVPLARALDFSRPPQTSRLSHPSPNIEDGGMTARGNRGGEREGQDGLVQRIEAQRIGLGEQASRNYAIEIAGSALVWADSSQLSARSEESRGTGQGAATPRVGDNLFGKT